jgi:hypothetical protein
MAENLVISSSQFSSNINENQFVLTSTTEEKDYLDNGELIEFYDLEKCVGCIKKCGIVSPKVSQTSMTLYGMTLFCAQHI